ncbi:LLM class flavin-dependent oxidoreductase [Algoriphagus sp. D3-2-R+10]|uniref:Atu2307/SP_0267 family LLM class monooxygenase n=1 Tax=Algoriphagus aurantiacus TaxID=3103948 RepID=UPI002B3EFA68|nr:Atu2307/SP_0267 family LLM class monooxygenase [Algoriphagus sp. D3-2-R+10]MEB2774079.1 LLM class flavin-dependent oxidoreductase [Algoriphagus sp. D3-2-R+10]
MEIGIDSFASGSIQKAADGADILEKLLKRIEYADQAGLSSFGIGEHHRSEFFDSAPAVILAAAAARTKQIRLTSAVTVLSAADPVRVFQEFATLDLISKGRIDLVVGRGSFIESFPLFGFDLNDYDALFMEKLELLIQIQTSEKVTWSGKFRPPLKNQAIYPRLFQDPMPLWIGVGGTPASFVRAGRLGIPLMIAIIGGEPRRFRGLIDMYKDAGIKAGHAPEKLKVGIHCLGYVASSRSKALADYYPGYAETFTRMGRERGWPPITPAHFNSQVDKNGALIVGEAEEVAEKILRFSEDLGGISRLTFQMDNAGLSHAQLMDSIELIGSKVITRVTN